MRARAAVVILACAATIALDAFAAPRPTKPPPSYVPSPVAISRVRVEARQGRILVTTDLTLPGGRAPREDLDVHVSYGGPGMPIAFDAQLIATPKGYLVAPVERAGDRLTTAASKRCPSHAAFVIGRCEMAGSLVHVPAASLSSKLEESGQVTLRLREVRELPAPLQDGQREILVRLGARGETPYVLGLIELATDQLIGRTEAVFCGLQPRPGKLFVSAPGSTGGIAPPLAERGPHDDLCLRFGPGQGEGVAQRQP